MWTQHILDKSKRASVRLGHRLHYRVGEATTLTVSDDLISFRVMASIEITKITFCRLKDITAQQLKKDCTKRDKLPELLSKIYGSPAEDVNGKTIVTVIEWDYI